MDDTKGAFGGFGEVYITEESDYYTERLGANVASSEEICTHDCHDIPLGEKPCACRCDTCDCIFCYDCKKPIKGDFYEDHPKRCGGGEK